MVIQRFARITLGAMLLSAGCDRAQIERYQVPRVESPPAATRRPTGPPQRMIAAIVPVAGRTWFFKVVGPETAVTEHKDDIDRFIQSVRFEAEDKPTWTVPEGWTHQPGSDLRFATFRFGSEPLELTVIPLAGESGSTLANVNRWRGQIGLGPISDAELSGETQSLDLGGVAATRVDMTGPGGGPSMTGPFAGGASSRPRAPSADEHVDDLKYATPPGWEITTDPSGMSVVAFQIGDGESATRVTVMPLPGRAGGLVANINRWRRQIGLDEASDEEIRRSVQPMQVAGGPASYVDLAGSGDQAKRILGVATEHGGQTWFFKMTGPAETVANEKAAFEAFMRSVRFH